MKTLKQNIINLFGVQGAEWIINLPTLITALTTHWGLSEVSAVSNMTFNYVAKAKLNTGEPVVLKISYESQSIRKEQQALTNLGSRGVIKLIDYNRKYNALLLQQALPGIRLSFLYPEQQDYVMDCYVDTLQRLHHKQARFKQSNYPQVADWLKVFDSPALQAIPNALLNKAVTLSNKLLTSSKPLIFLHGDLHHDNILKHGHEWLAIDPKGVIGEAEFEIAAFDFMYINELAETPNVKNLFAARVELLAQKSGLDAQRIRDWVFVRLMLMAVWFIEDRGDPRPALKLAELIGE
ncbi:aminoglycoside phosphotransferase family protein [Legionella lytica]|uniref:Aminoglycoside phosphotransferase family protein n=1 Tax=Legionella lytica TaxID=96232 RepID=A0ABW8DBN0_9GAMM